MYALICLFIFLAHVFAHEPARRPNIILFLADDMGYGDLASYGHPSQEFLYPDLLSSQGLRFTNWYSAASFCTPSRAALLTGRQAYRSGLAGNASVFLPCFHTGLPHSEITLAEALKDSGYSTGIVGKWHLGINKYTRDDGYHLPDKHGFDFVGTILPHTLEYVCDTDKVHQKQPDPMRCFLYEGRRLIEQPVDLDRLTPRLVHDAQAFLYNQTKEQPFFLYVSFPQAHIPMFNMPGFKNSSRRGVYGDQLMEMSWAMESVMATLQQLQLHHNTLSIFLSDHGPHVEMCSEGGQTGMLRGGKGTYFEGGLRIPAVMYWPAVIQEARVIHKTISSMDIFPTLLEITGITVPQDRPIDGTSFSPLLFDSQNNAHNELKDRIIVFLCEDVLMAARYKKYKIHFRTFKVLNDTDYSELCYNGIAYDDYYHSSCECHSSQKLNSPLVYNVDQDPRELYPLSKDIANDLLEEIQDEVTEYMKTLTPPEEKLLERTNCVISLNPCCNPPYCICK